MTQLTVGWIQAGHLCSIEKHNTMKSLLTSPKLLLAVLFLAPMLSMAQSKFTVAAGNISVKGTSTMHDWEMTSKTTSIEANFSTNATGGLVDLASLSFSIPAESLKSGKGAMDKNAYKALKTSNARTISFTSTNGTVAPAGANTYTVKCTGKLSIAGTSRETDLVATLKVNPDKSLSITGIKKLKMTDYKVEPPSFMFGSVTTGDDIAINFNVTLKK